MLSIFSSRPRTIMEALSRPAAFLPILIPILLLWAGIGIHLVYENMRAEQAAFDDTDNLARGFGEVVARTIEGVERTIKIIRNVRARYPDGFDLKAISPAADVQGGPTLQIAVTDRNGMMVGSNLPGAPMVDLADRPHIRIHFEKPGDFLYISAPVLGRASGKWSIQFTRKLFARDGTVDGVIVVSLDPYYMSRFYESLDIGDGSILLVGLNDGIIRAQSPLRPGSIGSVMAADRIQAIRSGGTNGRYRTAASADGIDRTYSYRRLDDYGLAVAVGLATDEVFLALRRDKNTTLALGGLLSALFAIAGVLLVQQRQRLLHSRALMAATLENISQGIVMVDQDGNVPLSNRRALRLLDLPDEVLYEKWSY
ncbi:MAG: PAS-domain containing protein, partial [Proteobacteria bacterium]|nr:PAS-domain containing protein [Pseudomonadota bacterium]